MDALQVRCGGWRPADTHQELSICSMRASISCSSMNSPRSACAMPFCTAAETGILLKKAQGSFTSRSASRTGMVGDLGKLRFLLGSEMDFHTPALRSHLIVAFDRGFSFLRVGSIISAYETVLGGVPCRFQIFSA